MTISTSIISNVFFLLRGNNLSINWNLILIANSNGNFVLYSFRSSNGSVYGNFVHCFSVSGKLPIPIVNVTCALPKKEIALKVYVLLPYPVPEDLYDFLATLYKSVNSNFFSFVGIDLNVDPLSTEMVTSDKALFFKISSDVLSPNVGSFSLLLLKLLFLIRIFPSKFGTTRQ